MIALTLWYVLSQLWAVNADVTGLAIKNQLAVAALFLATRSIKSQRELVIIAWGYLVGCLIGAYLLFVQNPDILAAPELSTSRAGIEGVNINYLSYALAVGLAVIVLLWSVYRVRVVRIGLAVCILPLVVSIWYSNTRGAEIAVVLLAIWILVHHVRGALVAAWLMVAVCALTIATGAADGVLHEIDSISVRSTGDLAGRLTIWPFAREVFSQHFIAGVGAAGFQAVDPTMVATHNVILEFATGLGLVGVLTFLGLYVSALVPATKGLTIGRRSLLVGAILLVSSPMYLSGQWDLSPAAWLTLAMFSRIPLLTAAAVTPSSG
ncbi:O-antigen ligase family protein [Rathayibacter soli]|uniref:O-antigen ligase family protein n=1 Tax=Rathayibacter soli TaxID=3144168 RepID=UPI0027E483A2|nr:O-antigen ligase family protein [Glaciibacter superstes]